MSVDNLCLSGLWTEPVHQVAASHFWLLHFCALLRSLGCACVQETLDPALTRPGRFDRNVAVPVPDVRGRLEILEFYLKVGYAMYMPSHSHSCMRPRPAVWHCKSPHALVLVMVTH